jgi:tight adherence protein C
MPTGLVVASIVLFILGLALVAADPLMRMVASRRSAKTLKQMLARRASAASASRAQAEADARAGGSSDTGSGSPGRLGTAQSAPRRRLLTRWMIRLGEVGERLLDTPLGKQVVAREDRHLLDQCGYTDARSRGLFLLARFVCACATPVLVTWTFDSSVSGMKFTLLVIASIIAGFLLPKWLLTRQAASRRRTAADELPMMVDLLRLLQGVGLSLDQSLQVMINDFSGTMPVLASELGVANRQFVAGRTREQSLQRLATSYQNDDLRAIVRLIIQIDKYGGAVQEPLRLFGERLRETRRMTLRERIGRLTVKMTGVMIFTLLPALMIVTAGPGFITVVRSLTALSQAH